MLPTRTPGSPLDRLVMAAFTFLAVGCGVLGVRAHGEPFAWALSAGVLPLLYWNAMRARGLATWAALPLFLVTVLNGSPIALGIHTGICLGGLARSGFFFAAVVPPPSGRPNVLPVSVGQQFMLIGGSMLARQRILDIIEDQRDDGSACTSFVLDPAVVPLIEIGRASCRERV